MLSLEELTALAVSDEALQALSSKSAGALAEMLSEDFARMKDFGQNNPHHCLDLLTHTLQTAMNVKQGRLAAQTFEELRIAALFHDIGKPSVAKPLADKTVYYRHAEASERIARGVLAEIGVAPDALERICFYIRRHDMFVGIGAPADDAEQTLQKIGSCIEGAIKKYRNAQSPFVPDYKDFQALLYLCRADIAAQSEEVYENGRRVNSRKQKTALINAVSRFLKEKTAVPAGKPQTYANKSFLFFPIQTDRALTEIADALNASGCWKAPGGKRKNKAEAERESENTRYLLRHVGGAIRTGAGDGAVCVQRQFDAAAAAAKGDAAAAMFQTVYRANDRERGRVLCGFTPANAFLFCFDTGVGLLALEIRHGGSDLRAIADSLFLLKECNKKTFSPAPEAQPAADTAPPSAPEALSPRDLAETLLTSAFGAARQAGGYRFVENWSTRFFQRIFIMTYLETAAPPDAEQLFFLSHCYNGTFRYTPDTDDRTRVYRNNDVCTWGFSTESAACVAPLNTENEDFIRSTFRGNISGGYLLLFVLLLHQKYVLQDFLAKNDLRNSEKDEKRRALAREYRDRFYLFEQKYNFRYISDIAQYQNLYEIVYDAFKIDHLFQDVKEPLEAIKEELDEQEQREDAENDKKTERALTVLSLFAVFSAFTDAWGSVSQLLDAVSSCKAAGEHIAHLAVSVLILVFYAVLGGPLLLQSFREFLNGRKKD